MLARVVVCCAVRCVLCCVLCAVCCVLRWTHARLRHQFMGVEIPAEYGGSESNFMSAIILIEELAKVLLNYGSRIIAFIRVD